MTTLNVYEYQASGNYSHTFSWNDGGSFDLGNCLGVLNDTLLEELKEDEYFNAELTFGVCQNFYNDHAGSWSETGFVVVHSKKEAEKLLNDVAEEYFKAHYVSWEG